MNKEELCLLTAGYEMQNSIEIITKEELLDIIPESELYPNLYLSVGGIGYNDCISISDNDWQLLQKGFNPLS